MITLNLTKHKIRRFARRVASRIRRVGFTKQPDDHDTLGDDLKLRFRPIRVFEKAGIEAILWFEDVLVFYGSDTAVFDLYLLVRDSKTVSTILQRSEYIGQPEESLFPGDHISSRGGLRLIDPHYPTETSTVLIDSSVWDYDMKDVAICASLPLPPLYKFLESLMSKWLNMSEEAYNEQRLWAMSLVNLINYCYNLPNENAGIVRSVEFAQQLQPRFRQLHFDLVGKYPKQAGISYYGKHKYHAIRSQQIEQGLFAPVPYSTANFPPSMAEYPQLTGLDINVPKRVTKKSLQSIEEGHTTNSFVSDSPP